MSSNNTFTLGKDVTIQIITPNGVFPIPVTLTSFNPEPQWVDIDKTGMDSVKRSARIPNGWGGTIELDRNGSGIDDYFAAAEAAFYAGQNQLNCSITETINEINGQTSQYRYVNAVLKFKSAGNRAGDKEINIVVEFQAQTRLKVA